MPEMSLASLGRDMPVQEKRSLLSMLGQTWPAKLAEDMWSAFKAPGNAYRSTPDNPVTTEQMIKPVADLAGLVMGGTYAAAPAMKNASGMGIKAYHGSPHDFDRFSLSKIGTGEGAQVYGHGLYFAEKEATAKAYRDALAPRGGYHDIADALVKQSGGDWQKAAEKFAADMSKRQQFAEKNGLSWTPPQYDIDTLAALRRGHPGRMYEVDINADPAKFLDWDKPIGDALWNRVHPEIRSAADEALDARGMNAISDATNDYTGRELYKTLKHPDVHESLPPTIGSSDWYKGNTTESRHVAEYLREHVQLPGIKYLDQGSRASGDGSRNYVVFDDSLISILKKYGIAGVAAPSLAAGVDNTVNSP